MISLWYFIQKLYHKSILFSIFFTKKNNSSPACRSWRLLAIFLLKAKVLAPAATKTNFGNIATGKTDFDYDKSYPNYHTSEEMADFLIQLYESDKTVGYISRETFEFNLSDGFFQNAFSSKNNVKF